jgi:PEP-CTERM motif
MIKRNTAVTTSQRSLIGRLVIGVYSTAFLSAIVCSPVSYAQVSLSSAIFEERSGPDAMTESYPSSVEYSACRPVYGCGSGEGETINGDISTAATAETNGLSSEGDAGASIQYQFYVTDPTADYVQVNIQASLAASAVATGTSSAGSVYTTGSASAYSELSYAAYSNTPIGSVDGMVVASASTEPTVGSAEQSQSLNATFYVLVNSKASLYLLSSCYDGSQGGSSFCNTYVDPIVQITPAFLADNPEAKLIVSPGIDQVIGVPEPATWAMMLIGFAGLGFAGYRRSRKPRWRKPRSIAV